MCLSVITSYSIHYTKLYDEKGAFPAATAAKIGKFELADNGTIFLDEIGEDVISTNIGDVEPPTLNEIATDILGRKPSPSIAFNDLNREQLATIASNRITSYNVCYTKLLRLSTTIKQSILSLPFVCFLECLFVC